MNYRGEIQDGIIDSIERLEAWLELVGGKHTVSFIQECASLLAELENHVEYELSTLMEYARSVVDVKSESAVSMKMFLKFYDTMLLTTYLERVSELTLLPYTAIIGMTDAESAEVQFVGEALGTAALNTRKIVHGDSTTADYYKAIWENYMNLSTVDKYKLASDSSRARALNAADDALYDYFRCRGH